MSIITPILIAVAVIALRAYFYSLRVKIRGGRW